MHIFIEDIHFSHKINLIFLSKSKTGFFGKFSTSEKRPCLSQRFGDSVPTLGFFGIMKWLTMEIPTVTNRDCMGFGVFFLIVSQVKSKPKGNLAARGSFLIADEQ